MSIGCFTLTKLKHTVPICIHNMNIFSKTNKLERRNPIQNQRDQALLIKSYTYTALSITRPRDTAIIFWIGSRRICQTLRID